MWDEKIEEKYTNINFLNWYKKKKKKIVGVGFGIFSLYIFKFDSLTERDNFASKLLLKKRT